MAGFDPSQMSDAELQAALGPPASKPSAPSFDPSRMSDAELQAGVQAPPARETPSVTADVGRGAASGAAFGAGDIAGLPGSVGQLYDLATEKMLKYGVLKPAEWMGIGPPGGADKFIESVKGAYRKTEPEAEQRGDVNRIAGVPFMTGQGAERALRAVAPVLNYDPQTREGKFAESAARMGVNSLAGGPGSSVPAQVGLGAVAGLGAEGAGQLATAMKFPEAEPYARFAGALLAPAAAQRSVSLARGLASPKSTGEDVFTAALGKDLSRSNSPGGARMKPEDIQDAAARGAAPMAADMAGDETRKLLKKLGYTSERSTEYFDDLNQAVRQRAATSGTRVADQIAADYGIATDSAARQAQIEALNKPGVNAAYTAARADPTAQAVWSQKLDDLTKSKSVQDAMKIADNVATDPGSKIVPFRPASQTSPAQIPNLDYWDQVKRKRLMKQAVLSGCKKP
jgi:predicted HD phosphohydrolase